MIDYERVVREFGDRIYHVHAKDMEIDRDGLYEHGVLSAGHRVAGAAAARASARSAGTASSPPCTRRATTTPSSSSTRTASSRAATRRSRPGSCSPATRSRPTSSERRRLCQDDRRPASVFLTQRSPTRGGPMASEELLTSWNDTATRQAIVDYVARVTTDGPGLRARRGAHRRVRQRRHALVREADADRARLHPAAAGRDGRGRRSRCATGSRGRRPTSTTTPGWATSSPSTTRATTAT